MTLSRRTLARLATTLAAAGALGTALPAFAADPRVKFVTSEGDFVVEVYPDKAPKTVENFLQYVKDKHYDGTIFHRVIKNFMVQGGGYDKDYKQKPNRPSIKHEGREALAKGLKNDVGTVAMARTGDPHSATSQFFINVVDNSRLDPVILPAGDPVTFEFQGQLQKDIPRKNVENHPALYGYTVFGKVVSGMDTVEKIRNTPTGAGGPFPTDVPQKPVVIQSATLVKLFSEKTTCPTPKSNCTSRTTASSRWSWTKPRRPSRSPTFWPTSRPVTTTTRCFTASSRTS